MIELCDIVFYSNKRDGLLFDGLNLKIESGTFVSVTGTPVSGKSVLAELITGKLHPASGKIYFDGRDITLYPDYKRAANLGYITGDADRSVCGELTLIENISLADLKGKSFGLGLCVNKNRTDFYNEILSESGIGLEKKLNEKAKYLSKFEKQVFSLTLALMRDADTLILDGYDEGLNDSDTDRLLSLTDALLKRRLNLTCIMFTRNLVHALKYGDRIIALHRGKIEADIQGQDKINMSAGEFADMFRKKIGDAHFL